MFAVPWPKNSRLNRNRCFEKVHLRVPRISKVERSRNTQRERDIGGADMTTAQPNRNRPLKIAKRMKNRPLQIIVLIDRDALAHIAEDDAGHLLQQSGITQVQQHAVPLIGFSADIFEKENALRVDPRSIGCTKRLRENRDTSTI